VKLYSPTPLYKEGGQPASLRLPAKPAPRFTQPEQPVHQSRSSTPHAFYISCLQLLSTFLVYISCLTSLTCRHYTPRFTLSFLNVFGMPWLVCSSSITYRASTVLSRELVPLSSTRFFSLALLPFRMKEEAARRFTMRTRAGFIPKVTKN
jgi:hypothetical protein